MRENAYGTQPTSSCVGGHSFFSGKASRVTKLINWSVQQAHSACNISSFQHTLQKTNRVHRNGLLLWLFLLILLTSNVTNENRILSTQQYLARTVRHKLLSLSTLFLFLLNSISPSKSTSNLLQRLHISFVYRTYGFFEVYLISIIQNPFDLGVTMN